MAIRGKHKRNFYQQRTFYNESDAQKEFEAIVLRRDNYRSAYKLAWFQFWFRIISFIVIFLVTGAVTLPFRSNESLTNMVNSVGILVFYIVSIISPFIITIFVYVKIGNIKPLFVVLKDVFFTLWNDIPVYVLDFMLAWYVAGMMLISYIFLPMIPVGLMKGQAERDYMNVCIYLNMGDLSDGGKSKNNGKGANDTLRIVIISIIISTVLMFTIGNAWVRSLWNSINSPKSVDSTKEDAVYTITNDNDTIDNITSETTSIINDNTEDGITSITDEESKNYILLNDIEHTPDSELIYFDEVYDNFGTRYANGIGSSFGKNQSVYILSGKYKRLTGKTVMDYNHRNESLNENQLWIYGDGNLLYKSEELKPGSLPESIDVDVSGINELTVVINGDRLARLVDCFLYENDTDIVAMTERPYEYDSEEVSLKDLIWFNGSSSFYVMNNVQDCSDHIYSEALALNGGHNIWQEYMINDEFASISGVIFLNLNDRDISNSDGKISVYGDDELLFESPVVTSSAPLHEFNVDLTGINKLGIEVTGFGTYPLLGNCILSK